MDSVALSNLALGVAALVAVILGFLVAVAAIVFQSTVTASSAATVSSADAVARLHGAYQSLSPAARRELWVEDDAGHAQESWLRLLRLIADASFRTRDFPAKKFEEEFTNLNEAVKGHAARAQARYSSELRSRVGRETPHSEQTVAFSETVKQLDEFLVDQSINTQKVEESVALFANLLDVWVMVRETLRWAPLGLIWAVAALVIALAGLVHEPSIGEHEILNLFVAVLLVVGAAALLVLSLRPLNRLRGLF